MVVSLLLGSARNLEMSSLWIIGAQTLVREREMLLMNNLTTYSNRSGNPGIIMKINILSSILACEYAKKAHYQNVQF